MALGRGEERGKGVQVKGGRGCRIKGRVVSRHLTLPVDGEREGRRRKRHVKEGKGGDADGGEELPTSPNLTCEWVREGRGREGKLRREKGESYPPHLTLPVNERMKV